MQTALYLASLDGLTAAEMAVALELSYPVLRRALPQRALRRCSRDADGARSAAAQVRR